MKTTLLLFSGLFLPFFANAQTYMVGDTMTVVAFDGLNVRLYPNSQEEKIGKLLFGEQVVIIETNSPINDTNFGFNGNWIKIKSCRDSLLGYIFDAFISQFPVIQEMIVNGQTIKNDGTLNDGEYLLGILESYSQIAFKAKGCESKYSNGAGGTGIHNLKIINLENENKLITHSGWEWIGTEMELSNPRPSEIYYLVLHLLQYISEDAYKIDDTLLRNIQYPYSPCVEIYPQVQILIQQKEVNRVSIFISTATS